MYRLQTPNSGQVLDKVQLRVEFEHLLWEYLQTVVHQTVLDYQSEPKKAGSFPEVSQFSASDVGTILCKATTGKSPNEVGFCILSL